MYSRVSYEHITPGVTLVSGLQDFVKKQIGALFEYSEGADEQIRLLTEVPSLRSYNFTNYGSADSRVRRGKRRRGSKWLKPRLGDLGWPVGTLRKLEIRTVART
jgi:hypothetical protein